MSHNEMLADNELLSKHSDEHWNVSHLLQKKDEKDQAQKKLGSVQWVAWHLFFTLTLSFFHYLTYTAFRENKVSAATWSWRGEPQTYWLASRVWKLGCEERSKEVQQLRSCGGPISGPLPLRNHSNYLPQPQECKGRAAPWPLPRCEPLWGLRGSINVNQLTQMQQ